MATMRVYRPPCERCKARATFEVTGQDGKGRLYCGAHAKAALFELTMAEGETARPTENIKAVKS